MKNNIYLLFSLCFLTQLNVKGNNLQITNITHPTSTSVSFDISWDNSWRSGLDFHDAVWVFIKQASNGGPSWTHANVSAASTGAGFETVVPADQVGFFLRRSADGNGTSTTSVTATLTGLLGSFQDFKVMGVEMVYVPQGDFYAGDGGSACIARGDDLTKSVHIINDNSLVCGTTASEIQFTIGNCYDIPAAFPKGYNAFYCMKYHITQEQYVDFLNCLSRPQQEIRVEADVTGATVVNYFVMVDGIAPSKGNSIRCDANIGSGNIHFYCDDNNNGIPNEANDGLGRSCNYINGRDWLSYLDWAGLRAMTYLEIEKAARGPLPAILDEFSWGSTLLTSHGTLQNAGLNNEKWSNSGTAGGIKTYDDGVIRVGCNAPSSGATRELSNASYYGIIDLGNNPSDFYFTRNFSSTYQNVHGDGLLNNMGDYDVVSWPDINVAGLLHTKIAISGYGISNINLGYAGRTSGTGGRGIRQL